MKQLVTLPMAALLLLSSAGEAGAQWKSERWQSGEAAVWRLNGEAGSISARGATISADDSAYASESRPLARLVFGGVLGGAAGFAGGALLGYMLAPESQSDYDFGPIATVGLAGIAGEAALLPLGVHLENGRRGSYAYALAASTGIAALGLALAFNTADPYRGAALVSIPLAQLTASIAIERGAQQRK